MSIEKYSSKAGLHLARGFRGSSLAKVLPWVFSAAFLAGCARHYDMTLTNGTRITNVTKPKLYKDAGAYYYKDVDGKVHHISAGRVVDIQPHSKKNTIPGTSQQ
jgi:hypothetical protein